MQYKPCYEDVAGMVDEASKQFDGDYKLDKKKFDRLKKICELVDELVPEFECECVDVSVDDISKQLTIGMECPELIVENGREHKLFTLITMLDSFRFSRARRDTLRVEFSLNNMWERV